MVYFEIVSTFKRLNNQSFMVLINELVHTNCPYLIRNLYHRSTNNRRFISKAKYKFIIAKYLEPNNREHFLKTSRTWIISKSFIPS